MNQPRRYHLIAPNISEFKGGIQVFTGFLLRALRELESNSFIKVSLKHDSSPPLIGEDEARYYGNYPPLIRTGAFSTGVISGSLLKRFDLLISTHLHFTPLQAFIHALNKTPFWVVAHGIEAWDIQRSTVRAAIHRASKVLAVSSYTKDQMIKNIGVNPEIITILPNTYDEKCFTPGPRALHILSKHDIPHSRKVILTVARLDSAERYKGYDQVIRALPDILSSIPNAHYLIVGKGNDKSRVEKLISDLGLSQHVTLAGFVPDEELVDYYRSSDVFIMPSKGEGFGIVYLEALGCGIPTIGGNQDGAVDALAHGVLGSLVNPDSIPDISRSIINILLKQTDHPLLFSPAALNEEVKDRFGFVPFCNTLRTLIDKQMSEE